MAYKVTVKIEQRTQLSGQGGSSSVLEKTFNTPKIPSDMEMIRDDNYTKYLTFIGRDTTTYPHAIVTVSWEQI